ncbi:hypothetical protein RHHCN13_04860 [Rickettsia conorii subsp. heilongjiangensis]|uniref:Uncharacterized protein n=2 Tax=spotted fever group TaxID=114277 RepID=A0AAD1LSR5_RICCR|nr:MULTISPECIES: hypothetical protein [spotted fever group]AEK74947.1 hypothetical protein Rh054_05215 [Rickettsia conorii subsp. heilongjiangensis 054]KJW05106.1 hypothetical protein RAT170B_0809 [Rickettsia argasii T170-B]BBM91681.1 hypothetical protein RHCH81_04860 [Rickettsia conorii subsp. heilongjiangensis]BBM92890.1 hypothetical protein RHHCN13_04860 [Rickettsia conorii subsp. heilongjiangensis]BBM94099.1 hypothetical protein RHSENDAI29_04860 [Rickettsia conorii subsp. heilongjiangensis
MGNINSISNIKMLLKLINKVNNELHLITCHKAVKEAQALFKQHGSKSESFVDEFLKQKYQEANKENSKF